MTRAFGPRASQQLLFETVGMTVADWMQGGFNATVVVLGAAGSGKSHLLIGEGRSADSAGLGLFPRIAATLLSARTHTPQLGIAMWAVDGSQRIDLLSHAARLLHGGDRPSVTTVTSAAQCLDVLHTGRSRAPPQSHVFHQLVLLDAGDNIASIATFVEVHDAARDAAAAERLLAGVAVAGPEWSAAATVAAECQLTKVLLPFITGSARVFVIGTVLDAASHEADNRRLLKLLGSCLCMSNRCFKNETTSWQALISGVNGDLAAPASRLLVAPAASTRLDVRALATGDHERHVPRAQATLPLRREYEPKHRAPDADDRTDSSRSTRYRDIDESFVSTHSPDRPTHERAHRSEYGLARSVAAHRDVDSQLGFLDREIGAQLSSLRQWQDRVCDAARFISIYLTDRSRMRGWPAVRRRLHHRTRHPVLCRALWMLPHRTRPPATRRGSPTAPSSRSSTRLPPQRPNTRRGQPVREHVPVHRIIVCRSAADR